MLKKIILAAGLCLIATSAQGADEKIDPANYICAEFVASSIDGEPPLFEGLQIDGYAAARENRVNADSSTMPAMLLAVSDSCAPRPTDKVLNHWQEMRKTIFASDGGEWRADKTTCADYAANPDDGSGFVIWLDGYNRGKSGKNDSIFTDQKTLDDFLEACKQAPERLMLDVLAEKAK